MYTYRERRLKTLRDKAVHGLVRVHIVVFEHGVDLNLETVHNLLRALDHLESQI